ncbi:BQ5605_C030g10786 [Microbotryum silenes-dioicae]|uniref:BQ5605_C030g10786 protein n=1 Tax=Microbotryum silenes-dioicae TaxID=796604 RepID=A0A2X0MLD3_9BASI|nr:BQ5605_C030g10786 [Microbotryum silenes-dioicae]
MRSHYFAIILLHCAWFGHVALATLVAFQKNIPEHRLQHCKPTRKL